MTAELVPATCDGGMLTRLLESQAGVLHRSEVPPELIRHVRRELHARRWQRVGRDVFVSHNGALGYGQRLQAAVKASPRGSALAGPTAAELDGLQGFSTSDIFVTQPCGTRHPRLPGVVVHYSRFLDEADVHPLRTPRRCRPPRSIVDAAAWASRDDRARAIVLAAVQQRLVTPDQLHDALSRRGPCLRHALIAETIDDAAGGIASVPEREFALIVRAFHLPEPARQRILERPDGRYYLDADWAEFGLAVEVDGRGHLDVIAWDSDLDRANDIVIDGRTLLRFTSYAVRHRPDSVGETLMRALIARGWDGHTAV
ncbi:hypothetical protein [Jiangella mangrovi]|uniref:DUF559 domain-containing protein n=1 Tax=Jiangella mangrovi TaxID=1524084 RepID=A0A7W9LLM5_9ACTN|nr:hypothetical protein [Jiangella mangrovi]MBB5788247.1 hypothetical protein [Jiangella mangrovi]